MTVLTKPSLSKIATDPLRNFKFQFSIHNPNLPGMASMGFMSVDGLSLTTEVIPYREGGFNVTTQNLPGQTSFNPLTLSKGLIQGEGQLWKWVTQLFDVIQGTGKGRPGENFRFTSDLKVLDFPVTSTYEFRVKAWYRFYNCWPSGISYSTYDAGANAISVQQLTLTHEGFDFELSDAVSDDLTNPPG